MSEKLNVAVIMGGASAEHEISLSTGRVVIGELDKSKYNVKPIGITKNGQWVIPQGYIGEPSGGKLPQTQLVFDFARDDLPAPTDAGSAITKTLEAKVEVAFLALHGTHGEDGCIQGMLELMGIPYTGSGVAASAIAMDKVRTKEILSHHGIPTPRFLSSNQFEWTRDPQALLDGTEAALGFPCVAKTRRQGSSVGVGIVRSRPELADFIEELLALDSDFLVEEYIEGKEITASVLGGLPGEMPRALPITEIVPRSGEFFDYEAKYTPGAAEEITPAGIPDGLTLRAQELGTRAHRILECGDLSRTDMIIRDDEIFVLETNTLPGMTPTSLYPKAAAAAGIEFASLLDWLITVAIERHRHRRSYDPARN